MSTSRRLLLANGTYIELQDYLLKSEAETLYASLDHLAQNYLKLTGGTVTGSLKIDTGTWDSFNIHRNNGAYSTAIKFSNSVDGITGYLGMGGSEFSAGKIPFFTTNGTTIYELLHSGNYNNYRFTPISYGTFFPTDDAWYRIGRIYLNRTANGSTMFTINRSWNNKGPEAYTVLITCNYTKEPLITILNGSIYNTTIDKIRCVIESNYAYVDIHHIAVSSASGGLSINPIYGLHTSGYTTFDAMKNPDITDQTVYEWNTASGFWSNTTMTVKDITAEDIAPTANDIYWLGTDSKKWAKIYATNVYGDITSNIATTNKIIVKGSVTNSTNYIYSDDIANMYFNINGKTSLVVGDTSIKPGSSTAGTVDLGQTDRRFKNGYFSGSAYVASGVYESSDERLKDFGDDIEVDLDKLAQLPKKYFNWKNSNDNTQIGTSAQELEKLYPELVTVTEDGYLNVAYDKLSIIALAGIDKLNEKINSLESRLEKLEKLIN